MSNRFERLNGRPRIDRLPLVRLLKLIERKAIRLVGIDSKENEITEEMILTNSDIVLNNLKDKGGFEDFTSSASLSGDVFTVSIDITKDSVNHSTEFDINK